ncbi:Uma2 family endonuclease [Thermocoleostomius sinensis]|jgi:Uma2 family endonuclease|uniref:Uma2 family endonuclease n=1 Tax=Thermocoleostomius sinensis A174 TaxID=2016057 RepID=A0A9E9C4A6_9CYAN|nr:Uma2 family endonuclease [Thermocoleostomius sinensis]WAL59836.1 Uma2 family endonuclease [Thermocoleostomius sinensis A174]
MVITARRADRVVLHHISWEQFEKLLEDLGDRRAARIAYDNGSLEIMTPLPEHEYFKEVMSTAVQDIAEALEIDYESYGSTTWRKHIKMAGIEPDNCFYFQHEPAVRGRLDLDLSQGDPPPDLALEIDLTHKSLDRFPIYARLEVPELWCYDEGELKIYHLQADKYIEAETSLALPMLPIHELPQLIETHRAAGRRSIRQAVREWAKRWA